MKERDFDLNERKNVRLATTDYVCVEVKNKFGWVGGVKDISMGGMAFEHVFDIETSSEPLRQVNIFVSINRFILQKLPCKIVYDVPSRDGTEFLKSPFVTKRCGIMFGDLTREQTKKLKAFLENYTTAN